MTHSQDTKLQEMAFCVAFCTISEPKSALLSSDFAHIAQKVSPKLELNSKPYDMVVLNDMPLDIQELKSAMSDKSVLVCQIGSGSIEEAAKSLEVLGAHFRIAMPFYNLRLAFASDYYHPTADIILHKADLLDDLIEYNADFHKASFVLPTNQIKALLGIAKN